MEVQRCDKNSKRRCGKWCWIHNAKGWRSGTKVTAHSTGFEYGFECVSLTSPPHLHLIPWCLLRRDPAAGFKPHVEYPAGQRGGRRSLHLHRLQPARLCQLLSRRQRHRWDSRTHTQSQRHLNLFTISSPSSLRVLFRVHSGLKSQLSLSSHLHLSHSHRNSSFCAFVMCGSQIIVISQWNTVFSHSAGEWVCWKWFYGQWLKVSPAHLFNSNNFI